MRDLETDAAKWDRGATVQVDQGGALSYRAALFVLPVTGGWCWVEPSYLDPYGAATPAFHVTDGPAIDVTPLGAREGLSFFRLRSESGWTATVYPADDEDPEDVQQALKFGRRALEERGTTWAEERERVRKLIDPDTV